MSQQTPEQNIRELAEAANSSIRQQREKAATLAAAQSKPSRVKEIVMALLLLVFASVAWVQYPRFHEPFGHPDPNKDQAVAEADLNIIAFSIQTYRLAQGKYPTTLDQVRLPEPLPAFVAEQKIEYRPTENAYVLEWKLPRWHAVLNGETGKVDITPVNGAK